MACGVPTIMSAVGVNTLIIENGTNGFLATNEDTWFNELDQLIENADLRDKIGRAGQQTVMKTFSVEANKNKYLEVFKSQTINLSENG
jgi:glycosyltransferase involved in cell wall biosynthesis